MHTENINERIMCDVEVNVLINVNSNSAFQKLLPVDLVYLDASILDVVCIIPKSAIHDTLSLSLSPSIASVNNYGCEFLHRSIDSFTELVSNLPENSKIDE